MAYIISQIPLTLKLLELMKEFAFFQTSMSNVLGTTSKITEEPAWVKITSLFSLSMAEGETKLQLS